MHRHRAVITGLGIVSCIGNDKNTITQSLKDSRSGISFVPEYAELGLYSQVAGLPEIDIEAVIDRKARRFMGDSAAFAYIALQQAIQDAGLTPREISNPKTGIVAGSGGASSANQVEAADILRNRGIRKVGPYRVTRTMSNTVSACLATPFQIKGVNYSIASACATSTHCIGHALELIQLGKQDIVFAGGGEEVHWTLTCLFDAMGALSSHFNHEPSQASRPFDRKRNGFVIAGGGGMVVVESLEHAKARGAHIYAEITGYGCTSDGGDMVAPSGEGAVRCMQMALSGTTHPIDYINAHGTSTLKGDQVELNAIKAVFGDNIPPISSTKSLTGHSLGATGVQEVIFSLLMLEQGFISPSANIEQLDAETESFPIAREIQYPKAFTTVLSNNFGFGGTNASLVLQKITQA